MTHDFRPVEEQLEILRAGAVDVDVHEELRNKLERSRADKKPLSVKLGCDPTAPDLHLGHTVVINKLKKFQELGHKIVFLIGDFTARIGDPTGKNTARPALSEDEIIANAATYKRQVFKILDEEKTEIRSNSEWLGKMAFDDVIRLAAKVPLARMLTRDDIAKSPSIMMHELFYPLAQGYDSVALKTDVEIGGTDQRENLLMGRDLMREYGLEPQCIMTLPVLTGTDGVQKMSKSLNNYIGVEQDHDTQFARVMSIPDELMPQWFALLSDRPKAVVDVLLGGDKRRDAKISLAKEIVARFHGQSAAEQAEAEHLRRSTTTGEHSGPHTHPDDAPTFTLDGNGAALPLVRALLESNLAPSATEARRLITQSSVSVDGAKVIDPKTELAAGRHDLRIGKLKFARVVVT